MSLVSIETPWKPATIAMSPAASAFSIRPGVTSMILARPCDRVGDDAGLAAGERPRRLAEVGDRHRQQRHRDPLTRGEQHVELAARRQWRDLLGQVEQLVGGVAHGRHDDADVVAGLLGVDDPLRHPLDAVGVGDGGASVLLHDDAHGLSFGAAAHCQG